MQYILLLFKFGVPLFLDFAAVIILYARASVDDIDCADKFIFRNVLQSIYLCVAVTGNNMQAYRIFSGLSKTNGWHVAGQKRYSK
jgi:hypothetical protein